MRRRILEILSAVEFLDRSSVELVVINDVSGSMRVPLGSPYPFYVLIETSGSNEQHDVEKLESFLATVMKDGVVADGTVAQDGVQAQALWALRESVATAANSEGLVYKYDISLPITKMYQIVDDVSEKLREQDAVAIGYGHLGDANLHLNVVVPEHSDEVLRSLEPYVFEWTHAARGSISAEHGIGQCKVMYLPSTKPPQVLSMMKRMKAMLDPNGILNPYKVLEIEG